MRLKWFGNLASQPEINKLVQLSNLLGVSTDELLKDDVKVEVKPQPDAETKQQRKGPSLAAIRGEYMIQYSWGMFDAND